MLPLIGNHDIIGNGELVYEDMYGPKNFSFSVGPSQYYGGGGAIRFICLNTNALEYDYSIPVPDFSFIKSELNGTTEDDKCTIFVMHVPPGSEQFNNNVADIFQKRKDTGISQSSFSACMPTIITLPPAICSMTGSFIIAATISANVLIYSYRNT